MCRGGGEARRQPEGSPKAARRQAGGCWAAWGGRLASPARRGPRSPRFLLVSRFLKSAIVNRKKCFRTGTRAPTPRANPCGPPGGYLQGGKEPPGGDVRPRLGASPGAATAASPSHSDRDALARVPYGVPEVPPLASLAYPAHPTTAPAMGGQAGGCKMGPGTPSPTPRVGLCG
jgi:hypothetical protein